VNGLTGLHSTSQAHRLIYVCGLGAFIVLGLAAAIGFAVQTFSLAIAKVDVKELLVSGAVLGVILGIAAQQSLANLFAGLVLLFAHPFRVGSRVRFRAGALGGQLDGLAHALSGLGGSPEARPAIRTYARRVGAKGRYQRSNQRIRNTSSHRAVVFGQGGASAHGPGAVGPIRISGPCSNGMCCLEQKGRGYD
jgi:Mechanosensitive ion channel